MPDSLLTDDGDIQVSDTGDIMMVQDVYHHYAQQAYIRMMTEMGDFGLYPTLGASLEKLYGMPQTAETGEYGKELILNALKREGVFADLGLNIKAIPIDYNTIRFDLYITAGSRSQLILSIEQNLNPLKIESGLMLTDEDGNLLLGE